GAAAAGRAARASAGIALAVAAGVALAVAAGVAVAAGIAVAVAISPAIAVAVAVAVAAILGVGLGRHQLKAAAVPNDCQRRQGQRRPGRPDQQPLAQPAMHFAVPLFHAVLRTPMVPETAHRPKPGDGP